MRNRCPSARFVTVAKLPDHRLAFSRKSQARGCGVADAVRDPESCVWGVVYEISDFDLTQLDKHEGYRPGRSVNSYWRRECTVLVDDLDGQALTVTTYFADPEPNPPPPNRCYKDLLVAGARQWGLPADYLAKLERIEAIL
jgi:hypothetical protein